MHNARIRLLAVLWWLVVLPLLAQPYPPVTRSVLTTNIPAFGNPGEFLTRQGALPYLLWVPYPGDTVLSNYVVALSNLMWQSDNIVSNYAGSISNLVMSVGQGNTNLSYTMLNSNWWWTAYGSTGLTNAGAFIASASGLGTNTTVYGDSAGTNWEVMSASGKLNTNTAGGYTLIRNGQIVTSSNVNADHFSISNVPVIRTFGPGNDFFGNYTGTNWNDQFVGKANLLVGYEAGRSLSSNVNSSIYVGYDCGLNVTQASYNTIVGVAAAQWLQNDYNVMMGHHAGRLCSNTSSSVIIGEGAGEYGTNGTQSVLIGGFVCPTNSGTGNVSVGYYAGGNLINSDYNVFIGWKSGDATRTGSTDVFMGADSGHMNTSGSGNTFIGNNCGYQSKTGNNNTFIGNDAGYYNNAGSENIFLGIYNTDTTGSNLFNTFIAGGPAHGITNVFFGEGPADATPLSYTINATGGFGTDIAGAHLSLAGGKSTGTGAGGEIRFFTSPAGAGSALTTNALAQRAEFTTAGYFGHGTNAPAAFHHITADNSAANVAIFGTTNRQHLVRIDTNGNMTAAGTFSPTNGIINQGSASSIANLTITTNSTQIWCLNGTNQIVTLPDCTKIPAYQLYRFSTTNGNAKIVFTNATGTQTIRDGTSLSFTQIGIGSPCFFTDGAAWWIASKSKIVEPNASWSTTTNVPLANTAGTSNYVTFSTQEFNNSQGIAMVNGYQLYITNAGIYFLTYSAVTVCGHNGDVISLWLQQSEQNIARSRTDSGAQTTSRIPQTVNFIVSVTTNNTYFSLVGRASGSGCTLDVGAAADATMPACPSVILTVNRVSDGYP